MRALTAGLMLVLVAAEAAAGAWPRPKGETFVALGTRQTTGARTLIAAVQDIQSYTTLYLEHGLTNRLTVGLDAGRGSGPDASLSGVLVFARLPVWGPGGHIVAADLGLGVLNATGTGRETRIRPGLAWGRGFASRWGDGWLGLEASLELRQPSGDVATKVDLTAGLKPTANWMAILQIQSGDDTDAAPIVRLVPSVVRRLGPRRHLQLGAIAPLAGDDAYGATLALWYTF